MSTEKTEELPITRNQLRAGRILASLGVRDLAKLTGLSSTAIGQIETGRTTAPHQQTVGALVTALQGCGIEFAPGGWVRHHEDHEHKGVSLANTKPLVSSTRSELMRLLWKMQSLLNTKPYD